MRTFEHFPKDSKCPICKTNDDKECFLVAIDGTEDGSIVEAQPMHTDCLRVDGYRLNRSVGILYRSIK